MRLLAISVALAMALGCGPRGAPAQTTAPEAGESQASAAPAEPLDARERLLAATLARARTIQDEVAAVRVLPFKRVVPAERQTREEFAKVVAREFARELPRSESEKASAALYHLGFLRTRIDLLEALSDATTTQVAAYYNPETGKFYAVSLSSDPVWLEVMTAHELTHGLQDQHFDLRAYYGQKPERELTEDQLNARRFVVEGEATLVMSAYPIYAMQGGMLMLENEEALPIIDQQVAQAEAMTTRQMIASNAEQAAAAAEIGGDFAKAAEAMAELPPFVTVPLVVPYTRGMVTVYRVFRAGGWEAVARLYAEPPTSTEQVLHPQAKLIDARDEPVKIAIDTKAKALAGWEVIDTDTLGELMWGVYFSLWKVAEGDEAAAGWDGDQIVFLGKDDAQITLMSSRWDSADEAVEFRDGYLASLTARFGDAAKPSGKRKSVVHVPRNDGTVVTVMRKGSDVAIVDGAPDEKTGKTLATLALEAERTGG